MAREIKIKYSNSELVNKCNSLIRELSESGGASWTLQIPVNFEKDPDVLFCEMGNRLLELEKSLNAIAQFSDIGNDAYAIVTIKQIASSALNQPINQ